MRGIAAAALCLLTAGLAGCPRVVCPQTQLSLDELIDQHNSNARAVPRLWARVNVQVVHRTGLTWGSLRGSPNATLLLEKIEPILGPQAFVLVARETTAEVFRLGSSVDEGLYYFWYRFGDRGGAWVGRHALAGGPGITEMPVDPTQLLAIFGVFELPADRTVLPAVSMAMVQQPCAYELSYLDRQPVTGNILFRRQTYFTWSDTEPPRPFRVDLLDENGRRRLTATLSDYRSVAMGEGVEGPAPEMPTRIDIEWVEWPGQRPEIRSLRLRLSEMTLESRGQPRAAGMFWNNLPPGLAPVLVDRHLGMETRP